MPSWLQFLLVALASYRVARMISLEEGPYSVFFKLRRPFLDAGGTPKTWIGRGLTCPLCVGVWVSLAMLGISYVEWLNWLVVWLAVAGLQAALQKQER